MDMRSPLPPTGQKIYRAHHNSINRLTYIKDERRFTCEDIAESETRE